DKAGTDLQQADRARARLQELLRQHPGSPWLRLYLTYRNPSVQECSSVAAAFASRRDAKGEVAARVNLYRLLFNAGKVGEAGAQVERTMQAAQESRDPVLLSRAQVLKARHLWGTGKDLEAGYLLLRQAEPALFPSGPYSVKREYLLALANLDLELGRYPEGLEASRRLAELAALKKDPWTEANARYGMARAVLDQTGELPGKEGRQEAARLAQEALGPAMASRNRNIQTRAHWMLGILSHGEAARDHFDSCLAAADTGPDQGYCPDGLARLLAATDPAAAQSTIARCPQLPRQAKDPWSMAYAWREQMRLSLAAKGGAKAIADSRSALDAIEALRDQQTGSSGRAAAFSTWSEDYYWLSGRLLDASVRDGKPETLEQAFEVAERLRARSLIDALAAAHALPAAALPIRQRRGEVLEQISAVQRRLFDPALPAAERAAATRDLGRLEIQEAGLRNQLAHAAPALDPSRRSDVATLERVRQALAPDEALLSFQISSWEDERGDFAGGSWLLVTTRQGTRVYRLPARGELRPAVRLFNGTFERRGGAAPAP